MASEITTLPVADFVGGKLQKQSVKIPPPAPNAPAWKGPLLHEDWHATQAHFGGVDFWVQRGSNSEPVRLAAYKRPYGRGAKHEPMGQDPLATPVSALLVKSQVKALQRIRDEMLPRVYRDPTLGSYLAYLTDINVNWDSQKLHFYPCELTFVREGIQSPVTAELIVQTTYDAAKAQYDSLSDSFSSIASQPDTAIDDFTTQTGAQLLSDADSLDDAWNVFDAAALAQLDDGPDPAVGKNELSRSVAGLLSAGNAAVATAEQFAAENSGYIAETSDILYGLRDQIGLLGSMASDVASAVSNEPQSWIKVLVTDSIDLAILIQRELGTVSEGILAAVLESNQPGWIVDPFMVPAGTEISIPSNLDEFA